MKRNYHAPIVYITVYKGEEDLFTTSPNEKCVDQPSAWGDVGTFWEDCYERNS